MYQSLDFVEIVERQRRQDEMAKAERMRLLGSIQPQRPRFAHRLLASLGGILVSGGTWLQQRYADLAVPSAVPMLSAEHRSPCPE